MKFIYPAVFTKEEDCYVISFPDFDGCGTYGDDLIEAYEMAKEVMEAMVIGYYGDDKRPAPMPSDPLAIETDDRSFVSLVYTDFDPATCYAKGKKAAEEEESSYVTED